MREHFVILGCPKSKKNLHQIFFNKASGKRFISTSAEGRKWQQDCELQIRMQWKSKRTYEGAVSAEMKFYMPTNRRCDLSNLLESIQDALTKTGVIKDDSQIHSLDGSRKFVDPSNPRVEVTLTPFQEVFDVQ